MSAFTVTLRRNDVWQHDDPNAEDEDGPTETGNLVDRLTKSFAAIEAEKDPAALKGKLAEHGALLKELQKNVQSQSHMMDMMQHMMGGSMIGGTQAGGEEHK